MWARCTVVLFLAASMLGCAISDSPARVKTDIQELGQLSIKSLRARDYGSTIRIEKPVKKTGFESYLASYDSDGLRVYTRIDVPIGPAPPGGFPVIIFVHGWHGIDGAPTLDFYYRPDSNYYKMIAAYREAGFVVFVPGLRGHGTVNNIPAEGIEFMAAWDNGSYLSPVFYAIDILNLLDGLPSLTVAEIDRQRVNLSAHSQGGDVVLLTLAVAGEGSRLDQAVHAASIWAGTFAPRFTQLETYAPMQKTPAAFMSGDGSWTGSAVGRDGSVNPDFVFWYPADWIETVHREEWTWQNETWANAAVGDVLRTKLDEMYKAINSGVETIDDAGYTLLTQKNQKATIKHDPRVAKAMADIDAYEMTEYLSEPLVLQYSDRDFYSIPIWNESLCRRKAESGSACYPYEYAENTHSLGVSEHRWFSSEQAVPGWPLALRRDVALFLGNDPNTIE